MRGLRRLPLELAYAAVATRGGGASGLAATTFENGLPAWGVPSALGGAQGEHSRAYARAMGTTAPRVTRRRMDSLRPGVLAPHVHPARAPRGSPLPDAPPIELPYSAGDLGTALGAEGVTLSGAALARLHAALARPPSIASSATSSLAAVSTRLRTTLALESQFPGFSLEAALMANAWVVLRHDAAELRGAMRVFQDLAPSGLPTVGNLMPAIGRWVARSPASAAAKLATLQAVATTYLGCGLPPAGSLTPASCCFMDLSEAQISEAVFALAALLGREHGAAALLVDPGLLSLAPSAMERALHAAADRLQTQPDRLQALAAACPRLLHMTPREVTSRLDALEAAVEGGDASGLGAGSVSGRRGSGMLQQQQQQQQGEPQRRSALKLRELLAASPVLLASPRSL
ncbi:hypothetical protein FOA52_012514 [Chlamydomonas sp. UWO 241]|nr:hypothetical protein FOA52_012514 [Chlamydomonas sp. UWO 241]